MKGERIFYGYFESPIGWIKICSTEKGVISLDFVDKSSQVTIENACVRLALQQVQEYFNTDRRVFDIPLDLGATDFQRLVWEQLLRIPYGRTTTYQRLAKEIGKPKAVRAVGTANARNPIAIIVPCHRVIGSDGKLTGYGGGLWRKEWLLKHEGILGL
jgi:methylated-DNA-[protein]-cysteine S-methyltransferase